MADLVATGAAFEPPYNPDSARDPRGLYALLEAGPDDDAKTLQARFRRMSKRHHPDKGGDAKRYAEINAAYDILSDPEKRRHYDDTGCLPLGTDKVRTLALNLLTQFFNAYIEKCPDIARNDPLDFMRHAAREHQTVERANLTMADKRLKKLRAIDKRLKARDGHPLRRHLAQQIGAIADQRQQTAATVEALAYAIKETASLAYELDPAPAMPAQNLYLGGLGSIFGSTTTS